MMARLKFRNVHSFVDKKTGRVYHYFRHRGKRWPLPGAPGTSDFAAAYSDLLQALHGERANVVFAPATLGAVIEQFLASDAFTLKAPITRRIYPRS
jgi:hypothetical protein